MGWRGKKLLLVSFASRLLRLRIYSIRARSLLTGSPLTRENLAAWISSKGPPSFEGVDIVKGTVPREFPSRRCAYRQRVSFADYEISSGAIAAEEEVRSRAGRVARSRVGSSSRRKVSPNGGPSRFQPEWKTRPLATPRKESRRVLRSREEETSGVIWANGTQPRTRRSSFASLRTGANRIRVAKTSSTLDISRELIG